MALRHLPIQICLIHAHELDKIHLTDNYCRILSCCRSSGNEWMRDSIEKIIEVHDEFICGKGIRIYAKEKTGSRSSPPHRYKWRHPQPPGEGLIESFIFVFYSNTRNRNENFVLNF